MKNRADEDESLEEILASIRRIVTADSNRPDVPQNQGTAEEKSSPGDNDEVLVLTEAIAADERIVRLDQSADGIDGERVGMLAADSEADDRTAGTISDTASTSPDSFAPTASTVDLTLDQVVRSALEPMLRAWLDRHLPDIVERVVRDEVGKALHIKKS